MATLYLLEQGSKLVKEHKKIVVVKDGKTLLEIPEFKIERVWIFGNIQITTQAMKFLLETGIDTAFFTVFGKLIGRLQPIMSKNVYLRLSQYRCSSEENIQLNIAKNFVEGKVKNAKAVLLRYQRNHPEEVDFSISIENLDSCLKEINNKTKVSSLIGVEGRAAAVYFECFGKMFRKGLMFDIRGSRPARDPINSLLNLGYTMITNEMFSITSAIGFDPYVGFLHGIDYGRPSLALDLIEEFRCAVVDRLTLEIVNKEILKAEDFEERDDSVVLKENSIKEYFRHYEQKMLSSFQDIDTNEQINFRKQFFKQAQSFAKSLMEQGTYKPFSLK